MASTPDRGSTAEEHERRSDLRTKVWSPERIDLTVRHLLGSNASRPFDIDEFDLVHTLIVHEPPLFEVLPDASQWRDKLHHISETYATEGVFAAMAEFGALVEEGGPKYSEEMAQMEPTPEAQEMGARMMGNFDLFIAHELGSIAGYIP